MSILLKILVGYLIYLFGGATVVAIIFQLCWYKHKDERKHGYGK